MCFKILTSTAFGAFSFFFFLHKSKPKHKPNGVPSVRKKLKQIAYNLCIKRGKITVYPAIEWFVNELSIRVPINV